MGYPGGKAGAGVYQRIINQIPPHDVYVEAFLGDGAVLRAKRPAARTIAVELDPAVAEAFAAEFGGPDRAATYGGGPSTVEVHNCCGIAWLKHAFGLFRIPPPNPALPAGAAPSCGLGRPRLLEPPRDPASHDRAAAAAAASSGGEDLPGGERGSRALAAARQAHRRRAAQAALRRDELDALAGVGARETPADQAAPAAAGGWGGGVLRHHQPHDPAAEAPVWFVYLDPPYPRATRRSAKRLYRHEMTEAQHVELLDVAVRLPCPVAISSYWSPLYAAALQEWRCITFRAMTRGGRPATECLWLNYPEPEELHDYRFLGAEKRERERIARKVRTWAAGLRRLGRLERQAILAALR